MPLRETQTMTKPPEQIAHELCRDHFHLQRKGEYERRLPNRPDWQDDERKIVEAIRKATAKA